MLPLAIVEDSQVLQVNHSSGEVQSPAAFRIFSWSHVFTLWSIFSLVAHTNNVFQSSVRATALLPYFLTTLLSHVPIVC